MDRDFLAPATPVHFLGLLDSSVAKRARRLADLAVSREFRVLHAYTDAGRAPRGRAARLEPGLAAVATPFERPEAAGLFERRRRARDLRSLRALHVPSPALVADWTAAGRAPDSVTVASVDTGRFHPRSSSPPGARPPSRPGHDARRHPHARRARQAPRRAHRGRRAPERGWPCDRLDDGRRRPGIRRDQGTRARVGPLFARRRVLDAPGFFGKIDVFALHAEEELVPISLVEALSCGCASVVADRGDVAQLVGADAALFTRPGDVDAVVEALDRLGDPAERGALEEVARKRALERHGLGRLRQETVAAYG